MYREQLQFNRQPFQDGIDTAFFFSEGKRREIVDEIKQSLVRSIPLIILTGDQGSGKTMVCRMVEKELPVDLALVFLPKTVDSFDDMVGIVAQEVNVEGRVDSKSGNKELLQKIIEKLEERRQRLVIIFDEADRIFLATLERIRKLLDQVNGEKIHIQIVLSGNQQLNENFEQLRIVTFQDAEERRFELEPLDKDATWDYVNYCIKVATGQHVEFFSRDVVEKISGGAAGNFRKINQIAFEYLQTEKLDSSFMTLLDDIKDDSRRTKKKKQNTHPSRFNGGRLDSTPDYLNFSRILPSWVYYTGAICLVVLVGLILLGRSKEDEKVSGNDLQEVPVIVLKEVEPLKLSPEPVEKKDSVVSEGMQESERQDLVDKVNDTSGNQPIPMPAPEERIKKPETVVSEISPEMPVRKIQEPEQVSSEETESTKAQISIDEDIGSIVDKSRERADETFAELVAVQPVVEQQPASDRKKNGVTQIGVKQSSPPEPVKILTEGEKKKPIVAESTITASNRSSQGDISSTGSVEDVLFKKRLAAGARWLVGGGNNNYTVQLMVLTSENAEENLKNMLKTPEYRGIANHLFVLRRTGVISTVMVFYGEYPSLSAARNARNNLPVFLRKHHPYAISVHGAVEKANAVQQQMQ